MKFDFFNEDCVLGCRKHIEDESVDLIVTDPPYGIEGDKLERHYKRNESYVIDGYVEVPAERYPEFSENWINEAERILKPGGSIYIVSGYTNLIHILNALKKTELQEINHLIWKFNFGVFTKKKYISSHYHILFYTKTGRSHTFNTYSRYSDSEITKQGRKKNYRDREDVWKINREFKQSKKKNKNELPTQLLIKIIQYSSNEGDLVCDLFLGSFSTVKVAKGLNRQAVGFEISKESYDYQINEFNKLETGFLLDRIRKPPGNTLVNQGNPISDKEFQTINLDHQHNLECGLTKRGSINMLMEKYGRGYQSIVRIVDRGSGNKMSAESNIQTELDLPEGLD